MYPYKRIFVIVIDSFGVGEMDDAAAFGDAGANTLLHISEAMDEFQIPNLQSLGLANLCPLKQVEPVKSPLGCFTKLKEASAGKDTMTGHWEIMGLLTKHPLQTFTETGFPKELIEELEKETGHKIIGNKNASGTDILKELGRRSMDTGEMIVYTSADSVLQICGHEDEKYFGLLELYRCCKIARKLTLKPEWMVGRVIARPYIGENAKEFKRTSNRHDYAVAPSGKTAMDALKEHGLDVISIGKIEDIFSGQGITKAFHSTSSVHGMEQTIDVAKEDFCGLCFVNLVDFDTLWGHRRDPIGYGKELERFDEKLGILMETLKEEDLLLITADHGNDPTAPGTDHTREKVPFLAWSPGRIKRGMLKEQESFAVIGATIADNFKVAMPEGTIGTSLLKEIFDKRRI
ncbi:MAG: phosphopentomutase [Lachnospiraceae bacterium]|nr:phosphopentomutase [Lachnospiraceae bacterium]